VSSIPYASCCTALGYAQGGQIASFRCTGSQLRSAHDGGRKIAWLAIGRTTIRGGSSGADNAHEASAGVSAPEPSFFAEARFSWRMFEGRFGG
jgi:hypothetical protein